jgi:hypothetical protein
MINLQDGKPNKRRNTFNDTNHKDTEAEEILGRKKTEHETGT